MACFTLLSRGREHRRRRRAEPLRHGRLVGGHAYTAVPGASWGGLSTELDSPELLSWIFTLSCFESPSHFEMRLWDSGNVFETERPLAAASNQRRRRRLSKMRRNDPGEVRWLLEATKAPTIGKKIDSRSWFTVGGHRPVRYRHDDTFRNVGAVWSPQPYEEDGLYLYSLIFAPLRLHLMMTELLDRGKKRHVHSLRQLQAPWS